jgi:hypothetical protein
MSEASRPDPIDELHGIGHGFADQQHAMNRIVQALRAAQAAGSGADPAVLDRAAKELLAVKKAADQIILALGEAVPEKGIPGGDRAALTAGIYAG